MQIKPILFSSFLLLFFSLSQAQIKIKTYEEAKSQTWGSENAPFSAKTSERFKAQDLVILAVEVKADYGLKDEQIYGTLLARKLILVNDVSQRPKKFSQLWEEFQPNRSGQTEIAGLRVTKVSGSVEEFKITSWEQDMNISLQDGDLLDAFVYRSEEMEDASAHIFQPVRLYHQYLYPIAYAKYFIEVSKELYFIIKAYNEAQKFKNKQTPNSIQYSYEATNVERHPQQSLSPFLRTCPNTVIEVSYTATSKDFINSYVDLGTPGRAKHIISPKDVLRFYSDKVDKKIGGKLYYEAISKDWLNALKKKKITPKIGQTKFVTEFFNYIRNRYGILGEPMPFDKNGMIEAMSYCLTKSKIQHDLFVSPPSYLTDAKEIALYQESILIIKFREDRTLYISSFGPNDAINDVPVEAHLGKNYLITISEKTEYQKIKPVPFPSHEIISNSLKVNMELRLGDSVSVLNSSGLMDGTVRKNAQNTYISLADIWEHESKKGQIPPISREKKHLYDSLRAIKIQSYFQLLTGNDFKLNQVKLLKLGAQVDETEFEYEAQLSTTDLKAQNQLVILPSRFFEDLPVYGKDDNLARRGDIIFPSQGNFDYKFKIFAPRGFAFDSLRDEKSVKNDVGESSFKVEINDKVAEISLKYSFNNYMETPVYWQKVADILALIEKFRNVRVVLQQRD